MQCGARDAWVGQINQKMMAENSITSIHRFDAIQDGLTNAAARDGAFSGGDVAKLIDDALHGALRDPDTVFSLDVFDTLLLRDNSSEMSRFFEIGARMAAIATEALGQEISDYRGFILRDLGTRATYRAAPRRLGCREGSLTEIHRTASRLLCGDDRLVDAFVEAELDYEATTLTVNPLLLSQCEKHLQKGGRVILISDMYMHADQIKALLRRLNMDLDMLGDVTSSADQSVSKASGHLFVEVAERMDVAPERFFHIGDSWRGDYYQPCQSGWRALHLPLATADIEKRRADHLAAEQRLLSSGQYAPPIALPH